MGGGLFTVSGGGGGRRSAGGATFLPMGGSSGREAQPPGRPILGLKNVFNLLRSIPTGIGMMGKNIFRPDENTAAFWSMFGKGLARSVLSTGAAIADAPVTAASAALHFLPGTMPGQEWLSKGGLAARGLRALLPEDYGPQGYGERLAEHGLLFPLIEDIGNMALVAAPISGGLRLGAYGAMKSGGQGLTRAATVAKQAKDMKALSGAVGGLPYGALPQVTRGIGKAGQLEQAGMRVGQFARPYRSFAAPFTRKALAGGTFQRPTLTKAVTPEAPPPGAWLPEQFQPPRTDVAGRLQRYERKAYVWPGTKTGKKLVDTFDLGRMAKKVFALSDADTRGINLKVMRTMMSATQEFQKKVEGLGLSNEQVSNLIGEQLRKKGSVGDLIPDEVLLAERIKPLTKKQLADQAAGKAIREETRSELLRELKRLPEDQRAVVMEAFSSPTFQASLDTAVGHIRDWRNVSLGRARRESAFGSKGIEPELLNRIDVFDTPSQARRRVGAKTQAILAGGATPGQTPPWAQVLKDIATEQQRTPSRIGVSPKMQPLAMGLRETRDFYKQAYKEMGYKPGEIQAMLDKDGWVWSAIIEKMQQKGFDPVHFNDFSPEMVDRLVRGAVRNVGELGPAKTRTVRKGGMLKTAAHSLEALSAGFIELSRELRQGQFLKEMMNAGMAQKIPKVGRKLEVPEGWVRFKANKEGMQQLMTGDITGAGDWMVPKHIATYMRHLNKDYSHPVFQAMQKAINPWRTLVLTASPKWYFNNTIGNIIMATAGGVRPQDWIKAWRQSGFKFDHTFLNQVMGDRWFTRFPDAHPGLLRTGIAGEAAGPQTAGGLIQGGPQAFRAAFREGKASAPPGAFQGAREAGRGGWGIAERLAEKTQRWNQIMDEVSRVSVYEANMRKAIRNGVPHEVAAAQALDAGMKGVVDYTNLTPFERGIVRQFIPFYAWQKGILQLGARLAADHPAWFRAITILGQVNNELMIEEENALPDRMRGMIPFFGDMLQTERVNPFADADSLLDFDKTRESVSPLVALFIDRLWRSDPSGGFGPKEVGRHGQAVPQVNMGEKFMEDIALSLPIPRAIKNLSGWGLGEQERKPAFKTGVQFMGPTLADPAMVERARQRKAAAQKQVLSGAPFPAQRRSSSGGLFSVSGRQPSRRRQRALRSPVRFAEGLEQARR